MTFNKKDGTYIVPVNVMFSKWADSVLDGYIILTSEQVSSSAIPSTKELFQKKLDSALIERNSRKSINNEKKSIFHSDVVMKEELIHSYQHEMSGSKQT